MDGVDVKAALMIVNSNPKVDGTMPSSKLICWLCLFALSIFFVTHISINRKQ
jgi:hypothetical protein